MFAYWAALIEYWLTAPVRKRRLRRLTDALPQAEVDQGIAGAICLLESMRARMPVMVRDHERHDATFRKRAYRRWRPGFHLLKMFLVISEEFGATYNQRVRPEAVQNQDHRFEAIVRLHARSVRVANEIQALLHEGFPDGALARWRTLHECAVIATFLAQQDDLIAKRFLAYRGIEICKALQQYAEYLPRSGMTPLGEEEVEDAQRNRDALILEYGPEFREEMGWAYPVIAKKRGIKLFDLEKATGLDHWRPRFKWASDDIHASPKPHHASLGVAEARAPVLLTGRSNSAFTDPAHMCAISLNLVNHALPADYLDESERTILMALRILSDEIGETFLEADHSAPVKRRSNSDGAGGLAP